MNAKAPIPATDPDTESQPVPTQPCPEIPVDKEALVAAITRLAGHINAAQYRFLKLLAALIERDAWGDGGTIKSPAHWLNYYCGIDLGAAREKVRVAKRLAELPQIDAAFASGAISYSKVRALTRGATPQNEDYLLMIARHGTAQHVETLLRKYQRAQRLYQSQDEQLAAAKMNESDAAAGQFAERELHWYFDEDGMLVIRGRLTPEDGAMFIKAVNRVFDATQQPGAKGAVPAEGKSESESKSNGVNASAGEHESEVEIESVDEKEAKNVSAETFFAEPMDTLPQRRADALVLLAEKSWQCSDAEATPEPRHQLVMHIEKDSLMGNSSSHCSIEDGPFLARSAARRLACDTGLLAVLEDGHGNVLNVGRKTRSVSPALRRALGIRDHRCRFPGCTESRFVDAHHIHHWCDGGETSLENLVLLCRRHHRLVHEQGFELVNHGAGEIAFRQPDRRVLPEALYPQFSEQEYSDEKLAIEHQHQNMGIDIDETTAKTRWRGERIDYSLAVAALQNRLPGSEPVV